MKGLKFCVLVSLSFSSEPATANPTTPVLRLPPFNLQTPPENYGDQFWNDQLQRKTELWGKALRLLPAARSQDS